jgi:hypothetical protein
MKRVFQQRKIWRRLLSRTVHGCQGAQLAIGQGCRPLGERTPEACSSCMHVAARICSADGSRSRRAQSLWLAPIQFHPEAGSAACRSRLESWQTVPATRQPVSKNGKLLQQQQQQQQQHHGAQCECGGIWYLRFHHTSMSDLDCPSPVP